MHLHPVCDCPHHPFGCYGHPHSCKCKDTTEKMIEALRTAGANPATGANGAAWRAASKCAVDQFETYVRRGEVATPEQRAKAIDDAMQHAFGLLSIPQARKECDADSLRPMQHGQRLDNAQPPSVMAGAEIPVAWGEFYGDKCASVTLKPGRFNTVPLYRSQPAMAVAEALVAWIDFAESGNIRFWTNDQNRADDEKKAGRHLRGFTLRELVSFAALRSTVPGPVLSEEECAHVEHARERAERGSMLFPHEATALLAIIDRLTVRSKGR